MYLGDKVAPVDAAIADGRGARGEGHAHQGRRRLQRAGSSFRGTCSVVPPADGQGIPQRVPAAREVRLPDGRQGALDRDRAQRPDRRRSTVNGKTFNSVMPPMSQLTDDEIANILTYVRNSWGNQGDA